MPQPLTNSQGRAVGASKEANAAAASRDRITVFLRFQVATQNALPLPPALVRAAPGGAGTQ